MTPKEKAIQLYIDIFYILESETNRCDLSKKTALLFVIEILDTNTFENSYFNGKTYVDLKEYWQEVKKEIENL